MNSNSILVLGLTSMPQSRSALSYVVTVVRILVGAALVVFGVNGFLNFIPPPAAPLSAPAMELLGALVKSGYMMPLIATTQLVVGVLLVTSQFVPLALALLAPFLVHSLAFHFTLEPTGRPMALVFTVLELFLAWAYRDAFRPMLARRAKPNVGKSPDQRSG